MRAHKCTSAAAAAKPAAAAAAASVARSSLLRDSLFPRLANQSATEQSSGALDATAAATTAAPRRRQSASILRRALVLRDSSSAPRTNGQFDRRRARTTASRRRPSGLMIVVRIACKHLECVCVRARAIVCISAPGLPATTSQYEYRSAIRHELDNARARAHVFLFTTRRSSAMAATIGMLCRRGAPSSAARDLSSILPLLCT